MKIDEILKLNLELKPDVIGFIDAEIDRMMSFNLSDFNSCNEQYTKFFESRMMNIKNQCDSISHINSSNLHYFHKDINSYFLQIINSIGNESNFKLFEQFKYGNSNYVLFGKNGAGKTTLLNFLRENLINSNVYIAPATRNINYLNDIYCNHSSITVESALTLSQHDNHKTMYYLSYCMIKEERDQLKKGVESGETIVDKFINIFNSLGMERTICFTKDEEIQLTTNDGESYSFSRASDGEKTIAYFIMLSLLACENAFVIIDEPENHLNGSLMIKLFDTLEKERKDIKFVYSTHNINFVRTRTNCELIYLQKTSKLNVWKFKPLSDFANIPYEVILNIEGTNDDILFCEGHDKTSYDEQLFSILFPQLKVISSEGCEKVMSTTFSVNSYSTELRKKAYGIIDNDFRDDKYILKLRERNIFVLPYNEIENVYLLEHCLMIVKEHMQKTESIDEIKMKIISSINKKKDGILRDFASKTIRTIYQENKLEDIDDIDKSLTKLNEQNSTNFKSKYEDFKKSLEKCIAENDYNLLMKLVPGKMIIKDVSKILGVANDETYINLILFHLKTNSELSQHLKESININI